MAVKQEKERNKVQEKRRKKKPASTRNSKSSVNNREFAVVTYLFLAIFICLMGYMVYFQVLKSEDFINSSYNARQDSFQARITRGEILSADGQVLAQTNTDAEGNETRYYPYSNLFSHVVGYTSKGKSGIESAMNFNLLRSHSFVVERAVNEIQDEKSMGDTRGDDLGYFLTADCISGTWNLSGCGDHLRTVYRKDSGHGIKTGF